MLALVDRMLDAIDATHLASKLPIVGILALEGLAQSSEKHEIISNDSLGSELVDEYPVSTIVKTGQHKPVVFPECVSGRSELSSLYPCQLLTSLPTVLVR